MSDIPMSDVGDIKEVVSELNGPPGNHRLANSVLKPVFARVASYWWVGFVVGVLWLLAGVFILKFNHASVVLVGVLTGILFLVYSLEEFALAAIDRGARWLWIIFGVLLAVGGILCLIHPSATFAGVADILAFVFVLIGVVWMYQAFAERAFNDLWWLSLISGILMMAMGFWVSGQFFIARAYTLLVFAGIWAVMTGIVYMVRAFQIRKLADL
ncbi:MAG TPA: DUF308 domain-containing protein [Solirubrobacteraceae bacterium]|nr:DUF308 domain-containing protein [Solirubrobacteraceae bacterium]